MTAPATLLVPADEPLEVLRQRIFDFTVKCPLALVHWGCPFRLLGGLGHETRMHLIFSFTKQQCVDLLEMEQTCRLNHHVNI